MKIRKNDTVMALTGKDRGKTGRVIGVDRKKGKVLVEKLNIVKRHQRPTQKQKQGGIIEKEAAICVSNVMYYDEKAGKKSKLTFKVVDGKKMRVSRVSGEVIASNKL